MPDSDDGLARDLATLRAVAREAGYLALDYRRRGKTETWEKSPGHPVTEADLAANALIAHRLGAARPHYGWLSEETVDDHANRRTSRIWVVDPIDGTRAYMRARADWCVGLAVVERGEAVAGVVYAPELDRLYEARRGGAAFCNSEPIETSRQGAIEGCRMIANEGMVRHKDWRPSWPEMQLAVPRPNATLLRLVMVASGEWDATIALASKSDWDLAAASVIVEVAGGAATTHRGERFGFNQPVPVQQSVIAAGMALHPLLIRRTEKVRLPDPQTQAGP